MVPCRLPVLLVIALVVTSLTRAQASEFDNWQSVPPQQRAEQDKRDNCAARARRNGDAWMVAYFDLLKMPVDRRVAAAESLMKQSPKDRLGWLTLIQAESLIEIGRPEDAIALLDAVRTGSTVRLRYECDRVIASALSAAGRGGEAMDFVIESQDLAQRHLYADPGVDQRAASPIRAPATPVDPAAELYRKAVLSRQARDLDAAESAIAEVAQRHAGSPWAPPTRVLAGWVRMERGKRQEGDDIWSNFIAEDPTGPWRAMAQLARFDAALEYFADGARARRVLDDLAVLASKRTTVPVDAGARVPPPGDGWDGIDRELALRRILLALVAGDQTLAQGLAEPWISRNGKDRPTSSISGHVTAPSTGVGKLVERLATGIPLTPADALAVHRDTANVRIILADWWICVDEPHRARRVLTEVLNDRKNSTTTQRVYATMRLADIDYASWDVDQFCAGYRACLEQSADNPWAPHQHLALAVDLYARRNDEPGALQRLALIQARFPQSPEARSAGYYRGMIPWWAGRWNEAAAAWDDLDRRYPDNAWHELLETAYRPKLALAIRDKLPPGEPPEPAPNRSRLLPNPTVPAGTMSP